MTIHPAAPAPRSPSGCTSTPPRRSLVHRVRAKLTAKIGSTTLATYSNLNKAARYVQKSVRRVVVRGGQTVRPRLLRRGGLQTSRQTLRRVDDIALDTSGDTAPPADSPRAPARPGVTP
ncbi:hypothetical protein ACRAWF_34950 [Streptomyces sp. L7]